MAGRDFDREPRWRSAGYWVDRNEREYREGDQNRARDYDKDEQRRYSRRAQERGEDMRWLRGEYGPGNRDYRHRDWDTDLNTDVGIYDDRTMDWRREEGRDWGFNGDYGTRAEREENSPSWRRERWGEGRRPVNQDYDTRNARNQGRYEDRQRSFNDRDYDYDYERDYRDTSYTGRDMNLEGRGNPGRREYDPYRNPDRGQPGDWRGPRDHYDWEGDIDMQRRRARRENRGRAFDRDRDRGYDRYDNYWGEQEQRSYYPEPDAWWNTTAGRPDYTSGRRYWTTADRDQNYDWGDERQYDVDPGYQYEFGTDFDFMNEYNQRSIQRRPGSGMQRSAQDQWGGIREGWDEFEYGWEGTPYNQRARYREYWDIPGPFRGVGPSGYQRSDERIREDICEIFVDNGQIDSSGIGVDVQDGRVTLEGDVDRRFEKFIAEDIASSISGVNDVWNHIHVNADDGARVRGMGLEDVVMPGRILPKMRVSGVDGKRVGTVKEVRDDGFTVQRAKGKETFIPFKAVKRTNGQIILHVASGEIDEQDWKSS